MHPFIYIYPSISPSTYLSIYLGIYLSAHPSLYQSLYPSGGGHHQLSVPDRVRMRKVLGKIRVPQHRLIDIACSLGRPKPRRSFITAGLGPRSRHNGRCCLWEVWVALYRGVDFLKVRLCPLDAEERDHSCLLTFWWQ